MNIEDIYNSYALNDGRILSFKIDFQECSCSVRLQVRKAIERKRFQECEIELLFGEVSAVDISEYFRTVGGFSDITFTKTSDSKFYLSLDPYGNTSEIHINDNFVVIGSSLTLVFDNGDKFEIT